MYAFKGLVAETLFSYLPATGTQLQHALGNIFKNENLERIFASYDLDKLMRHGVEFDAYKHRHIFAYGLLGYLFVHAPDEVKRKFIAQHFILPHTQTLMPETKNRDMEAQCNMLSSILYGCKVKLVLQKNETLWNAAVAAGEQLLASESSVSYRYVRKKALKKALITLSEKLQDKDAQTEDYERRRQQTEDALRKKAEEETAEKQATIAGKAARKKTEKDAAKAKREEQNHLRDVRRRQAKAAAKLRKEEQAKKEAAAAAQTKHMSANKRRHLEDKAK
jgi:hypothetical protein